MKCKECGKELPGEVVSGVIREKQKCLNCLMEESKKERNDRNCQK